MQQKIYIFANLIYASCLMCNDINGKKCIFLLWKFNLLLRLNCKHEPKSIVCFISLHLIDFFILEKKKLSIYSQLLSHPLQVSEL